MEVVYSESYKNKPMACWVPNYFFEEKATGQKTNLNLRHLFGDEWDERLTGSFSRVLIAATDDRCTRDLWGLGQAIVFSWVDYLL